MSKRCHICKVEKELSEFNKNKSKKDGLQHRCRNCDRTHAKNYWHANLAAQLPKARERNAKAILATQAFIINYLKNHPCIDCGESDIVVLEFDHKDPTTKYKSVSLLTNRSINKVQQEIGKCEVRCANCHRRKTAFQRKFYRTSPASR